MFSMNPIADQGHYHAHNRSFSMKVRALTADDASTYQTLRLLALQESPTAFSSSYSDEAIRSPSEIAVRVTPAPDGSLCVFGAFVDEQLVGFVAFVRSKRAKLLHCAELAGMYVSPEFRRRGIGGALIDTTLAHARSLPGLRQVKLAVNATNVGARCLYRSRGFKLFGLEPDALCIDGRYYDEELFFLRLTDDASSEAVPLWPDHRADESLGLS
jgi:ribosomal protein S18 acetylase RimI-like enzyme